MEEGTTAAPSGNWWKSWHQEELQQVPSELGGKLKNISSLVVMVEAHSTIQDWIASAYEWRIITSSG